MVLKCYKQFNDFFAKDPVCMTEIPCGGLFQHEIIFFSILYIPE